MGQSKSPNTTFTTPERKEYSVVKEYMQWYIFLFILFLQLTLTLRYFIESCESKSAYTWFLYVFHHILDIFLFWSFLFLTTRLEFGLHLLLLLGVVIHWLTYDNKCIITVLMNRECGYPDEKWLDSLKNMLGLRNITEYFHFVWMFILALQDISKLAHI